MQPSLQFVGYLKFSYYGSRKKNIDQKHFISKMWNELKSSLFLFKIILNICASYMPTCFEEIFKVQSSVSLTEKCQEMI